MLGLLCTSLSDLLWASWPKTSLCFSPSAVVWVCLQDDEEGIITAEHGWQQDPWCNYSSWGHLAGAACVATAVRARAGGL